MTEYKETFKQTDQVVYDVLSWYSNHKRAWEPYNAKQFTTIIARDRDILQIRDREILRLNHIINQQQNKITQLTDEICGSDTPPEET